MEKLKTIERIEMMRNGKKIKCPKCEKGFVYAVGEPSTAYVFKCDSCNTGMVMTKKLDLGVRNNE